MSFKYFVIYVSLLLLFSIGCGIVIRLSTTTKVTPSSEPHVTFQIPAGEALMQYNNHEVLTARIEGKKHLLKVYALNTGNPTKPKYIITYP